MTKKRPWRAFYQKKSKIMLSNYEEYALKVYPFVRGVATFWENYLTPEGDRYIILNDAIHEGTIGTMNPILSLGLARMVMDIALDMSEFPRRHNPDQHYS